MPETVNLHMLYEKVGEVGATAREAKHAANNAAAKIDALALIVAEQGNLRSTVDRLEQDRRADHQEIESLKADKLRREGAVGLVEWISCNYPLLAAMIILAAWVGYANGIFHK